MSKLIAIKFCYLVKFDRMLTFKIIFISMYEIYNI
jgi:hypothetical protein